MISRLLMGIGLALAAGLVMAAAHFAWVAAGTDAVFIVQPGGSDVVVNVDGAPVSPNVVAGSSNLYSPRLRWGKHDVLIEKPGYVDQRHFIVVRRSEESYPVFPRLQRRTDAK